MVDKYIEMLKGWGTNSFEFLFNPFLTEETDNFSLKTVDLDLVNFFVLIKIFYTHLMNRFDSITTHTISGFKIPYDLFMLVKGLVINYGEEGATKWVNRGSETLCAPPLKTG